MTTGAFATTPSVLIVNADRACHAVLARQLEGEFRPQQAVCLAHARHLLTAGDSQTRLIATDVRLPDGDGRELCVDPRNKRPPVIVLTAIDCEAEAVRSLDAGADDYIRLPVGQAELRARLRAHLRAADMRAEIALSIGRFAFHPDRMVLLDPAARRRIRLTRVETDILRCLHRAAGQPVTRAALFATVWGRKQQVQAHTHTLETHMYRLRQKLEDDPRRTRLIMTGEGGYRLAGFGPVAQDLAA